MKSILSLFDIERHNDTVVLIPLQDLSEFEFCDIENGSSEVVALLTRGDVRNVILDFRNTDYYGSTALSVFLKLWRHVRAHDGQMVFCNLSAHEHEILEMMNLDKLWLVRPTRADAIAAIAQQEEPQGNRS